MTDPAAVTVAWTVRVSCEGGGSNAGYVAEGYGETPDAARQYLYKRIDERLAHYQLLLSSVRAQDPEWSGPF